MDSYSLIITPDAEDDLFEMRDYITNELLTPDTALRYVQEIRSEIAKLEYLAPSIKVVDDEPFHSMGIRKIMANNFFVYFWIEESSKTVYILNVIYRRRNQLKALSKLKIN